MEDLHDLLEWTGSLLLAKELSDLTLIVEGEAIRVLRTVLADSCEYFRYHNFTFVTGIFSLETHLSSSKTIFLQGRFFVEI